MINTLLFADGATVSDFVANVFPIARIVLLAIITLCCLVMIVTVLMQSSANQAGSSAISGGPTDSYFSQNRDNTRDGRLKRITITMASIIGASVMLFFITGFWLAI